MDLDVAIIGGGPGGSTTGALLCKYRPGLKVGIFEREKFPRDHVGESQLPLIGAVLAEMGVWDKIEAADFPVKIGATYRWGTTEDLWDFHFLPGGEFKSEPRPAPWAGQRQKTAFQVDRSVYDKILLDHAKELGCQVREECAVREVHRQRDRVTGLTVEGALGPEEIQARYFVDASGHSGILRRAMGVGVEEPSSLRNIAIWDYWQNAEWAVNIGVGGTRIQIMSLGYGWLWFIPLSPTRTSIGLVCPAEYYKKCVASPEELYLRAIADEPRVRALVKNADREGRLTTTKDWSFVAERMTGENWMLVGEASGFADPILSAGLTLTHAAAREAAFTILEMDRGKGRTWLREEYEQRNRKRVLQHIKFADYWYTANERFTDLKEFTREIARDSGLELDAESAWQWLGTGGFVDEELGGGFGGFNVESIHQIVRRFTPTPSVSAIDGYNGFVLDFAGAERIEVAHYEAGRVVRVPAYRRGAKLLPLNRLIAWVVRGLEHSPRATKALAAVAGELAKIGIPYDQGIHDQALQILEALVRDGWAAPRKYANDPPITMASGLESSFVSTNRDDELPESQRAASLT